MVVRFISKGKGKNRRSFPLKPKKKGVSVRSVSLQPSAVVKVNKEQIKLLNKGEPATFSKALNQVIIRARREGIPIYDTHVNSNDRRKPYHMWIVKDPKGHAKVKNSDTIVMAEHYGQAIDDFITIWNKERRMKKTIGYPQVQGTAEKTFRYKRTGFSGNTNSLKSTSSQLQWGFDLTDFKPNAFGKVLKELGIPQEYVRTYHEPDETRKERVGRGFVWEGEGIKIETKNNPITGQYGTEGQREPEINYAGYIGITGLPDQVKKAVQLIKKNTSFRKGESPNERQFI
jgi:hypothetical protein